MKPEIWINITFNAENRLNGKDEFLASLRQEGVVLQERKTWYPAACTGQEIELLQIFINSPLGDFLKNVVVYGAAWDLTKYLFKIFLPSLQTLKDYNADLLIERIDFELNDVSIKFKYLYNVDYISLLNAFTDLAGHLDYLKQQDIDEIKEISLPYELNTNYSEDGDNLKYVTPDEFNDNTDYFWKIEYSNGCMKCYYNPKDKAIVEV